MSDIEGFRFDIVVLGATPGGIAATGGGKSAVGAGTVGGDTTAPYAEATHHRAP
ncbi:hypothetical protein [Haloprofundus halobius]|uniref:hypothetical protein n=1 Tax=Haloprofundus halobius TaxID=2876194 RepID=UPI001CCC3065|nr:hypothetical protein [Haloprofundus halobius]